MKRIRNQPIVSNEGPLNVLLAVLFVLSIQVLYEVRHFRALMKSTIVHLAYSHKKIMRISL